MPDTELESWLEVEVGTDKKFTPSSAISEESHSQTQRVGQSFAATPSLEQFSAAAQSPAALSEQVPPAQTLKPARCLQELCRAAPASVPSLSSREDGSSHQ